MNRLFVQIYLSLVAVVAVGVAAVVCLAIAAWSGAGEPVPRHFSGTLRHVLSALPSADAPRAVQAEAVARLSSEIELDIDLFAPDGSPIQVDHPWERAPEFAGAAAWISRPASGLAVRLPDGRIGVGVRRDRSPLIRFLVAILGLGLLAGVAVWPVSRRLTARLEELRAGVEAFGAGDWARRVPEAGPTEVAALGRAFNRTAGRISGLIEAQKRVLASASHEFRSPLTRIRMALELAGDDRPQPWMLASIQDVEELDRLVSDLLLAGRSGAGQLETAAVDLGALAAEEGSRVGAEVKGAAQVQGDAAALRRLLRNLLENAARHGQPPLRLTVDRGPPACLRVVDAGAGVPVQERERIFEPFYRPTGHAEGRDGGVGLGLTLVREIAEAHGGTATYEEYEGQSAFVVRLPG